MKKTLFLTLVGVVGLTGMTWGQSWMDSYPSTLYLSNLSFNTVANGAVDLTQAPWVKNPTPWGWMYYSQPDPNGGTREIRVTEPNAMGEFSVNIHIPRVANSPITISYSGASWDNLTNPSYWAPNFVSPPAATINGSNFVNGLNPEGMLVGGVYAPPSPEASSSVFVTQAQELNVGLVFTNGQWTPAP
jgi:hypothetical protein